MISNTPQHLEESHSIEWSDIYERERERLFMSRIIRVYVITLVMSMFMFMVLSVAKPSVFWVSHGYFLRLAYVCSHAVGLLIAYKARSLQGVWLSVIISVFFSTCAIEGLLILQPDHHLPKYILFLVPILVALMLPVRLLEILQIAFGLIVLHACILPWHQTSEPALEIMLLIISGIFSVMSVYVTDNLRKTNAIKEALLLREQSKFWRLQKQLEKEQTSQLEEQSIQLGFLSREIQELEQRERERIGSLLHDHLQQDLAAAKMQVHLVRREHDQEARHTALDAIETAVSNAMRVTRTITASVVPNIPIQHGLNTALRHLSVQLENRFGLQIELRLAKTEPIEHLTRSLLYDSARELLFNVIKHSGVKQATLYLRLDPQLGWGLSVSDQGKGYQHSDSLQDESLGLKLLRQRVEQRDGTFEILSSPSSGMTVKLTIPKLSTRTKNSSPRDEAEVHSRHTKIRVLLADDNPDFRAEVVQLIDEVNDIEVIGQAEDGQQALDLVLDLEPDILIIDVNMSKKSGIEVTNAIRHHTERTRVIGFSMSDSARIAQQFIAAGGDAYLLKSMLHTHLLNTIRMTKRARDWIVFRSDLNIASPL